MRIYDHKWQCFFNGKSKEEISDFFKDCYEFVQKKCGEPYIVSAVVHMDEKTPHLHATYIPVVNGKDRKGDPYKRVNCSEFWKGYNSYGQLQDEFYSFITEKGHKLERGEIGSRAEHLSPMELKRQTFEKEIQELSCKLDKARKQFSAMESKVKNMGGAILSKKKLDKIQPEAGIMGTIKGISVEEIEKDWLKSI